MVTVRGDVKKYTGSQKTPFPIISVRNQADYSLQLFLATPSTVMHTSFLFNMGFPAEEEHQFHESRVYVHHFIYNMTQALSMNMEHDMHHGNISILYHVLKYKLDLLRHYSPKPILLITRHVKDEIYNVITASLCLSYDCVAVSVDF